MNSIKNYNGIPINNQAELVSALQTKGLGYKVEKLQQVSPYNGHLTEFYSTGRPDTGRILGSGMKEGYTVVQNEDAFGIVAHLAKERGTVHLSDAHAFGHGRIASASIDIGVMKIGDASIGDIVLKRLNIRNHHDGSGCLVMDYAPMRLKCLNGMVSAVGMVSISLRHTATIEARIAEFARVSLALGEQEARTEATYKVLAQSKVSEETLSRIMRELFPAKAGKRADTNTANILNTVMDNYNHADGGFIERDTGWNLLNAITNYTTHSVQTRSHGETSETEARAMSQQFGAGAQLAKRAMVTLVDQLEIGSQIESMLREIENPKPVISGSMVDWMLAD